MFGRDWNEGPIVLEAMLVASNPSPHETLAI